MLKRKNDKFLRSIIGNFIDTGVELIYVKEATSRGPIYRFEYGSTSYSEVEIEGNIVIYQLDSGTLIEKTVVDKYYLTLDDSKVIIPTKENIASLLLDSSILIKKATYDLISR